MKRLGLLLLVVGCASAQKPSQKVTPKVHVGDRWYDYRGGYLGMSPEDAKARDQDLNEGAPPRDAFWDEQLAVESASLWRLMCNECHGGKRSIAKAKSMPAPGDDWGNGSGTFFGRERSHAEIFRVIFHGTEPENPDDTKMPGWGNRISREQIWGLVWFLERASTDVHLKPPPGKPAPATADDTEE